MFADPESCVIMHKILTVEICKTSFTEVFKTGLYHDDIVTSYNFFFNDYIKLQFFLYLYNNLF